MSATIKPAAITKAVAVLQIKVKVKQITAIEFAAIEAYNDDTHTQDDWVNNSSPFFLSNVCVNYILRNLVSYDESLEDFYTQNGVWKGVHAIKKKTFDTIAATYPRFADECKRQMRRQVKSLKEVEKFAKVFPGYSA